MDCIVAISNNFFYTRSLPCHLWFYDKGKKRENIDKILMIDARNVFRKVSSTINDFSQERWNMGIIGKKIFRQKNENMIKITEDIKKVIHNSGFKVSQLTQNI